MVVGDFRSCAAPRLPILRLRFDDPARTWLQIYPTTGELLEVLDDRGRLYRWLFDLLTRHRPAWDIGMWLLSLAGLERAA